MCWVGVNLAGCGRRVCGEIVCVGLLLLLWMLMVSSSSFLRRSMGIGGAIGEGRDRGA